MTFRDGRYHLFHQAVPDAVEWNLAISWGHATSADLLTWEHQPPVLVPGRRGRRLLVGQRLRRAP